LLILPFALFAFLPGVGTPFDATAAENQMRYIVLFIDAIAVAAGFIVLRNPLAHEGERFYSAIGFAAITISGPLYCVFAAIQLGQYRAIERSSSSGITLDLAALDELSLILLLFAVALTYLATAALAKAAVRTGWIGQTAGRIFVVASLVAAMCVALKMTEVFGAPQNPIWGFTHWYAMPGFVLSIPAVPWIVPCVLGVLLLRRAGDARVHSSLHQTVSERA
jgi:hypothetical protein